MSRHRAANCTCDACRQWRSIWLAARGDDRELAARAEAHVFLRNLSGVVIVAIALLVWLGRHA